MIDYSAMTDSELERISNLTVLAMANNRDAYAELEDLAGIKFNTLGDLHRIMMDAQAAMTPRGREAMWNRDAQRLAYTPPILPKVEKTVSKIAKLRREKSMTQSELAEAVGVNIRQIQKYENGDTAQGNMTLGLAVPIATVLGVRAEDLL